MHERRRTVDHEQRDGPDEIQHHTKRDVAGLLVSLPGIPGIEKNVEENSFPAEQERIDHRKEQKEVVDQPGRELRVGRQQDEDKKSAGEGGHAVQDDRDLHDLLSQKIVAGSLLSIPHPYGDHYEDRSTQNEGGKQNMELGNDPDRRAVARVRKLNRRGAGSLRIGRSSKQRQKRTGSQQTALPCFHDVSPPSSRIR